VYWCPGPRRPLLDAGRDERVGSGGHRRVGALTGGALARAQRQLAEIVSAALIRVPKCAAGVDLGQKVLRGPAGPGLVCSAIGADLLVVGHGPRVAELLHRSVSWYCVRHAHCPVLVIPPVMTRRKLTPAAAVSSVMTRIDTRLCGCPGAGL
jgi:hypothetical protein